MNSFSIGKIIVLFSFIIPVLAGASDPAGSTSTAEAKNVAIKGYDCVSYFKAGKALQGDPANNFEWHGLVWYFISNENRNLFQAQPEAYAPQYDGYCAWAMTSGRKALTNPEVWKIVNGKLYLNCSRPAYLMWSWDIPGNIKKADEHWKQLKGKEPK